MSLNGRGERIRTSDPLVPNQVRYQTALRPELAKKEDAGGRVRSVLLRLLGEACWSAAPTGLVYQSSRWPREAGLSVRRMLFKRTGGASLSSSQVGAIVCCHFAVLRIFLAGLAGGIFP